MQPDYEEVTARDTLIQQLTTEEAEEYLGREPWERTVWSDAHVFYTCMALMDLTDHLKGWQVHELRVVRKEADEVLLMVKTAKGNIGKIAFVGAKTYREAFRCLYIQYKAGLVAWKTDKFYRPK